MNRAHCELPIERATSSTLSPPAFNQPLQKTEEVHPWHFEQFLARVVHLNRRVDCETVTLGHIAGATDNLHVAFDVGPEPGYRDDVVNLWPA